MSLWSLVFQAEVVEQCFGTGVLSHHDQQASENGDYEKHGEEPSPSYYHAFVPIHPPIAVAFSTPTLVNACPILPWPALLSRHRVFAGLWRRLRRPVLQARSCSTPGRRDPSGRRLDSAVRFSDITSRDAPAPWDRSGFELRP